jgi:hypothetical protein
MMFLSLVHFMGESQNSPTDLDTSLLICYHTYVASGIG